MGYYVAIDVGGTFTDCIVLDEKGSYRIEKSPTTPDDPIMGIISSLSIVAEGQGNTLKQFLTACDLMIVGSTVATNAVLQDKGAHCCMITTKGFRDILEMRPIVKKDVYNFKLPKPRMLIPRYLRFEVEERTLVSGEVLIPLKQADAIKAICKARAQKCEVVVICFLHSYMNPKNEKAMAKIVREEYPEAEIVLSSNVLPRPPEYDRFSTAALSGYISRISSAFLQNLQGELAKYKYKGTLLVTTSNAGVTTIEGAMEQPIQLLSSGPAAGVLAGAFIGKLANFPNVITIDMGGTSSDVSVIPNGRILTTNESMVGEQKNATHVVDVRSIGAGGGSVAWLDRRGILFVGPQSAGADPGPVCYGKGGHLPTVTDADVLLGYVPIDYFLGGQLALQKNLAEKAIRNDIAMPLEIDILEAAYSIYSIVNAAMANQIFLTCISLGYDPRDFILCSAGGAGAVHAFDVAARLGMKQIYIPKMASAFCAFGMMSSADFRYEFSRVFPRSQDHLDLKEVNQLYRDMEAQGLNLLRRIKGIGEASIKVRRGADIRYFAQAYDIEASMPETASGKNITREDLNLLFEDFHHRHEEIYGHADRTMVAATTSLRLLVRGERQKMNLVEQTPVSTDASNAKKRTRSVYFKELGGFTDIPCYAGDNLKHGNVVAGPAVIEERTTTVVIPPNGVIYVDRWGNYLGKLA